MLEIFVVWLYIFITSFAIGHLSIGGICKLTGVIHTKQSPIIYSLAGLISIMVIGGYLSVLMPMNGLVHFLIIITSVSYLFFKREEIKSNYKIAINKRDLLNVIQWIALILIILAVLVKSSGIITTPDSGGYHLPFIKWIEKYKAIHGTANVHARFGFNYQYHVLCAIYGMAFTGLPTVHALNGYLMVTLVGFLITEMTVFHTRKLSVYDIVCLIAVVFVFNMSNASSSFSPDFPATAMVMFAILLLLQGVLAEEANKGLDTRQIAILLLTIGAILTKISTLPIILINLFCFYYLFINRNWKAIFSLIAIGVIAIIPYLIRSYILSGYLVFPLYSIDIFNVPWKVPLERTVYEKEVIRTYALGLAYGQKLGFAETTRSWWHYLAVTNRVYIYIIGMLGMAVVCNIIWLLWSVTRRKNFHTGNIIGFFLILYICLGYWWINAPDPRFGNGYIISFIALSFSLCFYKIIEKTRLLLYYGVMSLLIILSAGMIKGQSLSKVNINFQSKGYNLLTQAPYPPAEVSKREGPDKKIFYFVMQDGYCWDTDPPCMYITDSCRYMGNVIEDGFAPIK